MIDIDINKLKQVIHLNEELAKIDKFFNELPDGYLEKKLIEHGLLDKRYKAPKYISLKIDNKECEKIKKELDEIYDIHNVIHDCYFDINNEEPKLEQVANIYDNLPRNIKRDIKYWGAWDTVVRENIYEVIKRGVKDKYERK